MDHAERFFQLFAGLERAYGSYRVLGSAAEGDKVDGHAKTIQEPLTVEVWREHLSGVRGIGVVPITDDNSCSFGAIDIDDYSLDVQSLMTKVVGVYPLVPCRTKSGGVHLYLFTDKPVPAVLMQRKLRELAASLGYGKSEVFPKQTQVRSEEGDIGNWINMPYFGGEQTTRYALDDKAGARSLEEFLDLAEALRQSQADLKALKPTIIQADTSNDLFYQSPPCLRILGAQGFPDGSRNMGLFALGVYCRLRYPDSWKERLDEYNRKFLDPALTSQEVLATIKSLEKKEYSYRCTEAPINAYCNRGECLKQKYGVNTAKGQIDLLLESLTKLDTDPPTWFLSINGQRVQLETEDLQNQLRFQRRCMDALNVMPKNVKTDDWRDIVHGLLTDVSVVEMPPEASADGQLWELIVRFCQQYSEQTSDKDELLRGRVWHEKPAEIMHFRISDLTGYLKRNMQQPVTLHRVAAVLKNHGATYYSTTLRGRFARVWGVAMERPEQPTVPALPNQLTKEEF